MVHFRPTTPYLLLDEKQDTAVELPEAEFAQCKQYPSVLYCPTVTIMTKNPQNSCLGALFLDSEPRQHCHMVFGKASEVIQAISPGNYMITSVEEIQIATHYFSSPQVKYEKLQRGTHVLKLSEDVKMVTTPSAIIKNHYSFTAAELTHVDRLEEEGPIWNGVLPSGQLFWSRKRAFWGISADCK